MPMDDATASDNCGEVTIDVTSVTRGNAGNYTIFEHSQPLTSWKQLFSNTDHHAGQHRS